MATHYRVKAHMGLGYKTKTKSTVTKYMLPESKPFSQEDLGDDKGKIQHWLEQDWIEEVVLREDKQIPVVTKTKGKTPTKGNKQRIWMFTEEELADSDLDDLNMKIQEVCASKKVAKKDRPGTFETAAEAVEFLTKDNK